MTRLLITLLIQFLFHVVDAGMCWTTITKNGRCQHLYKTKLSKEECCKNGLLTMAWSNHDDATPAKLFYWEAFLGGAPSCEKCHITCGRVNCGAGKKCVNTKKGPKCACSPVCSKDMLKRKVCGTNRKTFKNQCRLLTYNCRHHEKVEIAYEGKCRKSCKKVKCRDGTCMEDQNGNPHCIPCTKHCPPATSEAEQICGSDGITYESICQIRKIACENAFQTTVLYPGKCKANTTCESLKCPKDRKCLVDEEIKQPKCVMCREICEEADIKPHPMCGSNNITYSNFCEMRKAACESGVVIRAKHNGVCKHDKTSPRRRHRKTTKSPQ
ncbi:follistatin-like [Liolophura sinensis]|uniref:follistatin-like n=1 Tax=Liolophura sinensis TaxID=3198878 RepID=UPI0031588AA1